MSASKVWFISGASRGFGRIWTEGALRRGDRVAATARDANALADLKERFGDALLTLTMDVTRQQEVVAAVNKAHQHFGKIDLVISNAGNGLMGAVEETALDEARANFETNVLGTLAVIQAALPLLRAQKHGHILLVTSVGGLITFPLGGIYQATKFAVEGLGQTLAQEVAEFGIKVTMIEPGPFNTEFMSQSSMKQARPMPEYDAMRVQLAATLTPAMFGDPSATVEALFKVVDAEDPPLHFIMGGLTPLVRQCYAARLDGWTKWETVSAAAQG